jgi:hypothetical protein
VFTHAIVLRVIGVGVAWGSDIDCRFSVHPKRGTAKVSHTKNIEDIKKLEAVSRLQLEKATKSP